MARPPSSAEGLGGPGEAGGRQRPQGLRESLPLARPFEQATEPAKHAGPVLARGTRLAVVRHGSVAGAPPAAAARTQGSHGHPGGLGQRSAQRPGPHRRPATHAGRHEGHGDAHPRCHAGHGHPQVHRPDVAQHAAATFGLRQNAECAAVADPVFPAPRSQASATHHPGRAVGRGLFTASRPARGGARALSRAHRAGQGPLAAGRAQTVCRTLEIHAARAPVLRRALPHGEGGHRTRCTPAGRDHRHPLGSGRRSLQHGTERRQARHHGSGGGGCEPGGQDDLQR